MSFVDTIVNNRSIKELRKRAMVIDSYKEKMASLSDDELRNKTKEFQNQFEGLTDIKDINDKIDEITNEAFAVCREAAKRVLNQFPFIVQIMGALALNNGDIAEMKTGEGKTLTSTMAIYTNALAKKGVHVITVNEYLTKRDAAWMGQIYEFLGLTVGYNVNGLSHEDKKKAFSCDITYTTNSELGFDYLRDNMAPSKDSKVLVKGLNYCIIDECDSILIDDAKTPLIISGGNREGFMYYDPCQKFVATLIEDVHYEIDIEKKLIYLTKDGISLAEKHFAIDNLYDIVNAKLLHYINNALKANYTMAKDQDYIVKNNKVEIVDQNTGRVLEGRSFSDGLHQAIEAKENVRINPENTVLATITYQNFFRLYNKLAGMTGTAIEDEKEFLDIFNMKVLQIPTNKPVIRIDDKDSIYNTVKAKYAAIISETIARHEKGQPVLIGTKTVEASERLHRLFLLKGLNPELLNAKNDEREAEIIALAGQKGAITIATNMAGRGTDIKLGEGVSELGGLAVLGSERHESRRVDNQLRGRAGRQGDVGYSKFYVALEDDLLRRYSKKKYKIDRKNDQEITNAAIQYDVDVTQKAVEGRHYDARKYVLDYDNVLTLQRETIYNYRNKILDCTDTSEVEKKYHKLVAEELLVNYTDIEKNVVVDDSRLLQLLQLNFNLSNHDIFVHDYNKKDYLKTVNELIDTKVNENKALFESEDYTRALKGMIITSIDRNWSVHLSKMKSLEDGIHYRQYANQTPLVRYKTESVILFNELLNSIAQNVTLVSYRIKPVVKKESEPIQINAYPM